MLIRTGQPVAPSLALIATVALAAACAEPPSTDTTAEPTAAAQQIPVTTSSDEARQAFLTGRDLNERLRGTDAHEHFELAIELDPQFAWAHLLAGFTGSTAQEFWDRLESAVAASGGASEGERLLILAADAAAKGRAEEQLEHLTALVAAFPEDERAHNALGAAHFGRQEWAEAIVHYQHAIDIDPEYSPPYNQKGYAHRFLGDYDAAEASFQKYVELIPDDPNPYDSYAELLMKIGRFEESIGKYREALEQDPNFIASYIGVANNQIFMGEGEAARSTLDELSGVARNVGERRAALLWTARSHLHEADHERALERCAEMYALAQAESDLAAAAGDLNLMGDILLHAGRLDEAADSYEVSIETIEQATVTDDVKENVKRNILYDQARVALARGDLEAAKATTASYEGLAAPKQIPFELRQVHELQGRIALVEENYADAVAHLAQANQQNPEVLFLMAQAHHAQGHAEEARGFCEQAANFNALSGTYAYVRAQAQEMLAQL